MDLKYKENKIKEKFKQSESPLHRDVVKHFQAKVFPKSKNPWFYDNHFLGNWGSQIPL